MARPSFVEIAKDITTIATRYERSGRALPSLNGTTRASAYSLAFDAPRITYRNHDPAGASDPISA